MRNVDNADNLIMLMALYSIVSWVYKNSHFLCFFRLCLDEYFWYMSAVVRRWYINCCVLLAYGVHAEDCRSTRQGAPLSATLYVSATADYHSEGECQLPVHHCNQSFICSNQHLVLCPFSFESPPQPPLGLISAVMLVWRKGNINRTVSVL